MNEYLPLLVICEVFFFFFLIDDTFDTYPSRLFFYFVVIPLLLLTIHLFLAIFIPDFPSWPVHTDSFSLGG